MLPYLAANHLEKKDSLEKLLLFSFRSKTTARFADIYKGVKCQLLHPETGQQATHPDALRSISNTLS